MKKSDLNPEQQQVVEHLHGPLRVAAVAGSGKTTALVERVARLVVKEKVPVPQLLMISFSRAAKEEMKKRIDKRLPGSRAGECVRTFHSIGLRIWKSESRDSDEFELDTSGYMYLRACEQAYRRMSMEPESKSIIRFAAQVKNDLLGRDATLRRLGAGDPRLDSLAKQICAEDGIVEPEELKHAFFAAEEIRSTTGIDYKGQRMVRFVTFDDMIYQAAMLLRKREVRDRWSRRWRFILQDEAQDENEAQAAIVTALAGSKNYMVVGDPSQSIYGFRGSKPEKMLQFEEQWPGAKTIVMHRNYRSGVEIVDLANRVLSAMPATTVVTDEIGDSVAMYSERQTHAYVGAHTFSDSFDEAESVAENIKKHGRDGVKFNQQAVLLRMNRMTRDIEVALAKRAIPYRLLSGQSFFKMSEAQALFGYLAVMMNRADKEEFTAAITTPSRRLGKAFVAQVAANHDMGAKNWLASIGRVMKELKPWQQRVAADWIGFIKTRQITMNSKTPFDILSELRKSLQLDDYYGKKGDTTVNETIQEKASENLDAVVQFSRNFENCEALMDVVQSVEKHRRASSRKPAVTISTVHKAKGNEWQVVYLPQVYNGAFPIGTADLSEERRCFYVAVTRAMDELWVSRPKQRLNKEGEAVETGLSPFLKETMLIEDERDLVIGKRIDPHRIGSQVGLPL